MNLILFLYQKKLIFGNDLHNKSNLIKERFYEMESKEEEERYIVYKPNPKNKKANRRLLIYDQQKQEYFTKEEALAKILNILDQKS